jgi:hypothetical protein
LWADATPRFSLADADFCVLHSPFVKMVRKGFARLFYQDHLRAKVRQRAAQVRGARSAGMSIDSPSKAGTSIDLPCGLQRALSHPVGLE